MPESVQDRPTRSHEHIFLLAKQQRYYYDQQAIAEPYARNYIDGPGFGGFANRRGTKYQHVGNTAIGPQAQVNPDGTRNARDVWCIPTQPYHGAHFAVMPPKLVQRCILAGCPEGGIVLDPFAGSGTTGDVARNAGRRAVLIELNAEYCELIQERLAQQMLPLFEED
jgi:DNA modification methylase